MSQTPAEIEEAKRKAAEAEAAEKAEKDKQSIWSTIFDKLNPLNWGFGDLFMTLIVAIGAFAIASTNWGKDLISKIPGGWGDKINGWVDTLKLGLGQMLEKISPGLADKIGLGVGEQLDAKSAAEVATTLKGHAPAALLEAATKDEATWTAIKSTIKSANGGKLNMDFTNPDSITALITSKDSNVVAFRNSVFAAAGDGKNLDPDMRAQLNTALRNVIKGPQLNTLLSPANRETTFAILEKFQPGASTSLKPLLTNSVFMKDGVPSDSLRAVLTQALPDDQGQVNTQGAAQTALAAVAKDPAAQQALIDSTITSTLQEKVGEKNTALFKSAYGSKGLTDFANFYAAHGTGPQLPTANADDATVTAYAQAKASYNDAFASLTMDKEHRAATYNLVSHADLSTIKDEEQHQVIASLRKLTPQGFEALGHAFDNGVQFSQLDYLTMALKTAAKPGQTITIALAEVLKPENRETIKQWGTQNFAAFVAAEYPAYKSMLTQHNIDTILNAANTMGTDKDNQDHPLERFKVLNAFTEFAALYGNDANTAKKALDALTPDEISDFFKNGSNRDAFRTILGGLQISGSQNTVLKALKDNWGEQNKDHGLQALLANREGAAFLKDVMTKPASVFSSAPDFLISGRLMLKGGVIKDNRDVIINIKDELEKNASSLPKGAQMASLRTTPIISGF